MNKPEPMSKAERDAQWAERLEEAERDARRTDRQWSIIFANERDFCRFASMLIGAVYTCGDDAMKRFEQNTLCGESTHSKVTAHVIAPPIGAKT